MPEEFLNNIGETSLDFRKPHFETLWSKATVNKEKILKTQALYKLDSFKHTLDCLENILKLYKVNLVGASFKPAPTKTSAFR